MSYCGSGSFSNSLAAWKDETITLKEQMPAAFDNGSDGAKFLFYAMYPDVKSTLLGEIARNDLDLALSMNMESLKDNMLQKLHVPMKPTLTITMPSIACARESGPR